jgi:nicotinamidase-related amidase
MIKHEALGGRAVHLCIDMQRLFADDTPWRTPWMPRVLPQVEQLCAHRPSRNRFTRFIPARNADQAEGAWRRYWDVWDALTLDKLDPALLNLVAPLDRYAAPGTVFDKGGYSPWGNGRLDGRLRDEGIDTLVISGAETDVCVLAAVLGAVDRGYRVVVASDAVCSSTNETHDALLALYDARFGQQIEIAEVEQIIQAWR